MFSTQSDEFRDLITKMLMLDPSKRIKVDDALNHDYFTSTPEICDPSELPLPESKAEAIDAFTDSD